MHFEDIWNHAEKMGEKEEYDLDELVKNIQAEVDKLPAMVKFPAKQAEIVGETIYQVCQITRILNINSAAGLKLAIENHKETILDPNEK